MTNMYDLTVPVLRRGLQRLDHYLERAAHHALGRNFDPRILVSARLFPDMLPLAGQIQRASDNAKGGLARLAGVDAPPFTDDETSIDDLRGRIARTLAFIDTITPGQLADSADLEIELNFRSVSGTFTGQSYTLGVLLPNFWFHVATAHGILRHNGLPLVKRDFIGEFETAHTL